MNHPPPSAALDLVVALPDAARPVLHHLLTCRRCRRRAAEDLELAPKEVRAAFAASPTGTVVPDEVESAQVRRFLARRDASGEVLLAELLALPPEEAARRVEEDGRFRSWGLAWRLALASDELAARDVEEAARLARLLAAVAERLETAVPATVRAELLVRAGTNLGTARRLAGRFEEAETVLLAVVRHLPEDSAERAAWCRALGLLRRDQERPDEALALLGRAAALYARAGEPASAAAASVEEAWTLLDEAEPEHAAALLEAALGQLDPATQPAATIRAWQGLGWAHAEQRDSVAARQAFREAHLRLLAFAGAAPLRARLLWRQAELAARVGEVAQAEATFAAAREELERTGLAYEAVRAGLDLARWLVEQGRSEDLTPLAADLGRLTAGFAPEPLAAVASLRHAVARGTATVEAIAHVAEFLHRARSDRGLRFVDPPAAETPTEKLDPAWHRGEGKR